MHLFLERGRDGENYQCVVAPHTAPPTGNPTGDPLVHRPALNPLSHTSQGSTPIILSYENLNDILKEKLPNVVTTK